MSTYNTTAAIETMSDAELSILTAPEATLSDDELSILTAPEATETTYNTTEATETMSDDELSILTETYNTETYNTTEATMSDDELSILTTAATEMSDDELSILTAPEVIETLTAPEATAAAIETMSDEAFAEALDEVETIADHLAGLRRCADRLRSLRYVGAGVVVAMAQEPAMRDLLRLHAEIAINIEAGCDLAERGELQVYLGRDK